LLARKDEYGTYDVGILAKQNSKVLEPNHDVSVGEIRSIENLLKKYEYLFRSPLLIDIEMYKKRMLGQQNQSGIQELEQECKAAEELLTLTLKGWASKMPVNDLNKTKGLAQIPDTTKRSDQTWYSQ
jgi:intein/homing endonuclease